MRILSLGVPLPGPKVDNHGFADAPCFFDYDAIVVEPLALSALIDDVVAGRGEHATRGGERLTNGLSGPDAVALAELLRDRRDETARLLANGGLAVCFATPNAVHAGVAGFAGCDRYCWLPAPAGLAYGEPHLRRGAGSEIIPLEHDHPFGPFVEQFRGKLAYRAYLADGAPGVRVIARSAGGAAVAVELAVGPGKVVLLPPAAKLPTGDQRYAYSNAIQEGIRQTLRLASGSSAPAWLDEYALPGLRERSAGRDEAGERAASAREDLLASEEAVAELERYRALLWQEGRFGLEEPVRAALSLIGFTVAPNDIDAPAQVQVEGRGPIALVEVDAAEGAVGMAGHYRLRRRLEEAIAKGRPKRGLLVINGYRTRAPADRPAQYEDPLRIAAESMGYCLATTAQLYHAARAALEGDEATVRAFRERVMSTAGVLGED